MDYSSLRARPITANDEKELETKLDAIANEVKKMPHIISIYPKGSRVIAWVMLDLRDYSKVPQPTEQDAVKKKVSKKKTRRKKAN